MREIRGGERRSQDRRVRGEVRRGGGCWGKGNRGFVGQRLLSLVAAVAAAAVSDAVGAET